MKAVNVNLGWVSADNKFFAVWCDLAVLWSDLAGRIPSELMEFFRNGLLADFKELQFRFI